MLNTPLRNASLVVLLMVQLTPFSGYAFNGHAVEEGSFRLEIDEFPSPGMVDERVQVPVILHNRGDQAAELHLRLHGLVDSWYSVGPSALDLCLHPGESRRHEFAVAVSNEVFRALYPVHVTVQFVTEGGDQGRLHAVRIFESSFAHRASDPSDPVPGNPLQFNRSLRLDHHPPQIVWQYPSRPEIRQPTGWTGMEPVSRTSFHTGPVRRGGETRSALSLHPPWFGGPGTVFAEYCMELPEGAPLLLTFATAIRDHREEEPASDGVTFRVWVDDQVAYEHHAASKIWEDGQIDLSAWAGRTVRLRLESHPGPHLDTTCDGSFWAEPTLWAGPRPSPEMEEQLLTSRSAEARALLQDMDPDPADRRRFDLGAGHRAVYLGDTDLPSRRILGFAAGGQAVVIRGINIHIDGRSLDHSDVQATTGANQFRDENGAFSVDLSVWAEMGALKLRAMASDGRRITDLSLGPADHEAIQVYFGHGYAIRRPDAFRVPFGGHSLSTSHVGVDFDNGVSLLTASDVPPVFFDVDPGRKQYALHTRGEATLTLVPGARGALDCAIRYRHLYDKMPAPGVAAKAGRFVFDLWGGRYLEHRRWMEDAVAYGLTETLLTIHNWQRWGYDYRLPDIFPPNPEWGSLAELQALSTYCREQGIPWGLHDNYIDFYPDAADYSYDHICFSAQGNPVPAWLNEHRQAQSYRWRPDRVLPFVRRNLQLITPNLRPSHSFVDVFTSIPPIEFYDRTGEVHDAVETRQHWNDVFDTLRQELAPPAITVSEAGHDQLTGHLDGADCQFLYLSPTARRHTLTLACEDWERVPWYDAVLHDRFILHGAGYSTRYQGGRARAQHGIESDDYLATEILTGHALMTDRTAGLAGAVRKYWLAQPWARGVAMDRIEQVEFMENDLHRLGVRWASGAEARINRGGADWHTGGHILPPHGFLAMTDQATCTVERIDGWVTEQATWPGGVYVNTRGHFPRGPYAIRLGTASLETTSQDAFRLLLSWQARQSLPEDASVFVHVLPASGEESADILFQGDHRPATPTTEWAGTVRTGGQVIRVPEALPPGRYPIVAGLFAPGGDRFALSGEERGHRSYPVGTLVISTGAPPALESQPAGPAIASRTPVGTAIDFGHTITDGAFRLTTHDRWLQLTPLPDSPIMQVTLRTPRLCPRRRVTAIHVLDRDGQPLASVAFTATHGQVSFSTHVGAFAYRLDTGAEESAGH